MALRQALWAAQASFSPSVPRVGLPRSRSQGEFSLSALVQKFFMSFPSLMASSRRRSRTSTVSSAQLRSGVLGPFQDRRRPFPLPLRLMMPICGSCLASTLASTEGTVKAPSVLYESISLRGRVPLTSTISVINCTISVLVLMQRVCSGPLRFRQVAWRLHRATVRRR